MVVVEMRIKGESITVIRPSVEYDELYELIECDPEREQVENVLIAPGRDTQDMDEKRQNGDKVWLTLHFPKTYTDGLRGCQIEVYGQVYDVVGDPQPYMQSNTPGQWNRPVEVVLNAG